MPPSDGTPLPSTVVPRPRAMLLDEPPAQPAVTAVHSRPRVLVVDDEPAIRTIAKLMLEGAGYAVAEVGYAGEALARVSLAERPYTVIVLDYTLPDRAGTELIPELRCVAPRSRVILTSGRPEDDMPNHGADGYLPKPFSREQLLAAVRAVTAMTPT